MKEIKGSVAGRLFYTFGTVLLMAVVTICIMNYTKDGRVFQMPLLSAVAGTQTVQSSAGAITDSDKYKTIQYKKPVTKASVKSTSNSSKNSKSPAKSAPTPAPKAQQPVAEP